MSIKDWPENEKPREKLLLRGAAALSDAELLAIFLRTGTRGRSAVDVARDLLIDFKSLRELLAAEEQNFCSHHGLGQAKYAQLQAVLEMARRHLHEDVVRGDALTNPQKTSSYLRSLLGTATHEQFGCLYLDNRHRIIEWRVLFYGTIDSAAVYPRVVVENALKCNAAAVIAAHNHPSGMSEPSVSDQNITRRLKAALGLLDVRLLDHFIVGDGEPVSMAELGMV